MPGKEIEDGNKDSEEAKPSSAAIMVQTSPSIRVPYELSCTGNVAENWSIFKPKYI